MPNGYGGLLKQHALWLALGLISACADDPNREDSPITPSFNATMQSGVPIPGRYIVTLRATADPVSVANEHNLRADHLYHAALRGFAASLSDATHEALLRDPRVVRVEPDKLMQAYVDPVAQTNATWGLDRSDQRALPLNSTYIYDNGAPGVTAYIIDSGVRFDHVEFGGRASFGFDAFGGNGIDCTGHGTHVAGTVGSTTYGVAKQIRLVGVRVLDCSGTGPISGIIAGVNWVIANHVKPAVATMSLGGPTSESLDDAVRALIAAGVATAIAAGNGNSDACTGSPARVAEAMTVGAIDKTDIRASFSNFGPCVKIFAPGVNILSATETSSTATKLESGTSMATPHVAGTAALYLQNNPTATAPQVHQAIYDLATKGVVQNAATARNDLLYSRVGNPPPSSNRPPTVTWAAPADGATISGNASLRISATDDTDGPGTLSVQWSPDGGQSWHVTSYSATSGEYVATWPTNGSPDGSYTVLARATDSQTAASNTAIQVQVLNDAAPPPPPPPPAAPAVTWVNPVQGQTISGVVPIRVRATSTTDAAGSLQVSWRFNSVWHGATYNEATGNYESSWPTTASSNDSYILQARATDSGGRTTLVTISVQLSN